MMRRLGEPPKGRQESLASVTLIKLTQTDSNTIVSHKRKITGEH